MKLSAHPLPWPRPSAFFLWRLSIAVPFALVQTETFTVLAACQWFKVLNCESPTRSVLWAEEIRKFFARRS